MIRRALTALLLTLAIATPAAAVEWTVKIGDCTFTNENFEGVGYADTAPCSGFLPALAAFADHAANAWVGTSGTSLTVGTGSQALTLATGTAFAVGQPVRIARTSAPTTTFMDGTITAWDNESAAMTVDVAAATGSGTFIDWTVFVMRSETNVASPPLSIANGGTGATTAATARANLGIPEWISVKGIRSAAPVGPTTGDTWIVGDLPSGWSCTQSQIATYNGASWDCASGTAGLQAYDEELDDQYLNGGGPQANGLWSAAWWRSVTLTQYADVIVISSNTTLTDDQVRPGYLVTLSGATADVTLTLPQKSGGWIVVANTDPNDDLIVQCSGCSVDGGASVTLLSDELRIFVYAGADYLTIG